MPVGESHGAARRCAAPQRFLIEPAISLPRE